MTISHIDNSFYRLTRAQAKSLCVENRLPRAGYEMRADLAKLAKITLAYPQRKELARGYREAWVKQTRVAGAMVWAVHILWAD